MLNARLCTLVGVMLVAAASRLLPHPPNFTPVAAIALFGGASFVHLATAFAVPLGAMLLSDLVLGLTVYGAAAFGATPYVYGSFALIVCLGRMIRSRNGPLAIGGAALASSLLFFALTNFAVWMRGHLYPLTPDGLVACYVAALPFFRNTLAGDMFYAVLLFGGFALAERRFTALREEQVARTSP